jgi:flavin-dependent dehydrogenase
MEDRTCDFVVIGGGPAGSAAAITAARSGACVLLLERGRFPRHKVCGEFVSPESLRLLERLLGGESLLDKAAYINKARLLLGGSILQSDVSPPAAAITRYDLDFALWRAAARAGAECRQGISAEEIRVQEDGSFHIAFTKTAASGERDTIRSKAVVDASGRWSNLQVGRQVPSDTWVGLKAHFAAKENSGSVDLYFFPQGYCGVQPLANGRLNVCAMVRASAGLGNSLEQVFAQHPELWRCSRDWVPAMETVATAPLFFRTPQPVRGSVLLAGDAAGFIDPFVGDGISMALRSGALAAECLIQQNWSASEAAKRYKRAYEQQFLPVFRSAARVRRMLDLPEPLRGTIAALARVPGVAQYVLRRTRLS